MNESLFLNIIEKLEGLLSRLPASIQKPILRELTPLKELFLQQRPPRLMLLGSSKRPLQEILPSLFGSASASDRHDTLMEVFRWQNLSLTDKGSIEILDAREADNEVMASIHQELKRGPADIFIFLDDGDSVRVPRKHEIENLEALATWNARTAPWARVIGISLYDGHRPSHRTGGEQTVTPDSGARCARLQTALSGERTIRDRLLQVMELPIALEGPSPATEQFLALLSQNLPNQARVEMIRISGDRRSQAEVAQSLVKSTSAICAAIGAQPIPFADLPILTTLQLGMVSGIMYLSGRERSLRAATEFVAALGANVGAGMLLREGTRAVLKFFPGWGNVVCGLVAGGGTYAIGRAAIGYFVEGVSLRDARRTYLRSRKKGQRPQFQLTEKPGKGRRR